MRRCTMLVAALVAHAVMAAPPKAKEPKEEWQGEQVPLSLAVKTPEDLAFKSAVERQYLVFNLLAGGKLAWDRGDYPGAAGKWESLLRLPGLPPELEALVRPLAKAAREQAPSAGAAMPLPMPMASPSPAAASASSTSEVDPARTLVAVPGVVSGGGSNGPGGAVIMLRRAEGATPKPKPARIRAVVQKDKMFKPHVLAVPLGATVEFRNDDEIFHNVFSLSKPNDFDLGLYKNGASREQSFPNPGPVHLLCNIHSSMNGYVYVSDTPYFTQADASGRFTVKNVPPGMYVAEVWHEWSNKPVTKTVRVVAGMEDLALAVDGDRRPPAFVPDKAGKPRQPQLGY